MWWAAGVGHGTQALTLAMVMTEWLVVLDGVALSVRAQNCGKRRVDGRGVSPRTFCR